MFRLVGLFTLAIMIGGAILGIALADRFLSTPFVGHDGNRYAIIDGQISGPFDL